MPEFTDDSRHTTEGEAIPSTASPSPDATERPDLARRLGLPRVAWLVSLPSTMDHAHALASKGAPAGTLVVADTQTQGRGRAGRAWVSVPEGGLWCTLLQRPRDPAAIDLLSIRVGLAAARALDRFAPSPIGLKWPNDLMLHDGKLGGILVEARWREREPEWVAIGMGINLRHPALPGAAALEVDDRLAVLEALLPEVRLAAAGAGPLTMAELAEYARRDWARGRRVSAPMLGVVAGVSPSGAVLIDTPGGVVPCTSGSLVIEGDWS